MKYKRTELDNKAMTFKISKQINKYKNYQYTILLLYQHTLCPIERQIQYTICVIIIELGMN